MQRSVKISATVILGFLCVSLASAAIPAGYTGTPFACDTLKGKPQQIPGVVKGVFVDAGTGTTNACCTNQDYNTADHDVLGYGTNGELDSSVNAAHTTAHLGWMNAGMWMKYTVHVNTAGTYYVDFKLANVGAPPNLITLTYYDGTKVIKDSVKNLPKVISPPKSAEIWHDWTVNFKVDSVALDTGLQVFQIAFMQGQWNYDWMRFGLKGAATGVQNLASGVQSASVALKKIAFTGNQLSVSCRTTTGPTRISLLDCAGRTVMTNQEQNLSAGSHVLNIPLAGVRTGVYVVRLEQNGLSAQTRYMLVR